MPNLETAARLSLQSIQQQVRSLRIGLDQIKAECKRLEGSTEGLAAKPVVGGSDNFLQVMQEFSERSQPLVDAVERKLTDLERSIKELLTTFGEDPASAKFEDFLILLLSFAQSIPQCRKEIDEARKRASKQTLTAVSNTSLNSISSVATGGGRKPPVPGAAQMPMMEKGDLEMAIRQLKQGSGLRKNRRPGAASAEFIAEQEQDGLEPGASVALPNQAENNLLLPPEIPQRRNRPLTSVTSSIDDKPMTADVQKDLSLATEAIIRMQQQRINLEKAISGQK
jgi:hypothetical protein